LGPSKIDIWLCDSVFAYRQRMTQVIQLNTTLVVWKSVVGEPTMFKLLLGEVSLSTPGAQPGPNISSVTALEAARKLRRERPQFDMLDSTGFSFRTFLQLNESAQGLIGVRMILR
jgi:hypothetical protein